MMREVPVAGTHTMQITGRDEFLLIVSGPMQSAFPLFDHWSILSCTLKVLVLCCLATGPAEAHASHCLQHMHMHMAAVSVMSRSDVKPLPCSLQA